MKNIALLLVCSLLLTGCLGPRKTENNTPVTEPAAVASSKSDKTSSTTTDATPTFCATIYYGNDNADGFEVKSVSVEELTAPSLIQELISVGVLSAGTEVLSEELKGSCLHLDFSEPFRTLLYSMGSSGEYIIMGSVVNTFLDNFRDTVQSIYITVNGEILESGHVIYDFKMTRYN